MLINKERLAQTFTTLCEIDSPSRHEGMLANHLLNEIKRLNADSITADDSALQTGSDTGNLLIRFTGDGSTKNSVLFACHMDTVEPASGVKVARQGDILTSQTNTILGGDDKSGIAALLELITVLQENSIPHSPVELVFTTCEEIGLLGAKALDYSLLQSTHGYALDSSVSNRIITGAPAANKLVITITGLAAHSGLAPESGINTIAIAAEAISKLRLGRLDKLSTANLGLIQGGTATNIVPELVRIEGEVRSHSTRLLNEHTKDIRDVFNQVITSWPDCGNGSGKRPTLLFEAEEDFPVMALNEEEPVLTRVKEAAEKAGQQLSYAIAGGGSDANIFNGYGIKTAILPTGMAKVHTTDEQIDLNDMVNLTELLLAMVRADSPA